MLSDLVSSTVIMCFMYPVFMYLTTGRVVHLKVLVGVLSTSVIVSVLKLHLAEPRPESGRCGEKYGFPSGHVSIVTAFAVLYRMDWLLSSLWVALVGWSRVDKKCHTVRQVAGGLVTGLTTGLIWSL